MSGCFFLKHGVLLHYFLVLIIILFHLQLLFLVYNHTLFSYSLYFVQITKKLTLLQTGLLLNT